MEDTAPYAARLEIDPPGRMQRLSTLLRIVFVLPIFLILVIVMGGGGSSGPPDSTHPVSANASSTGEHGSSSTLSPTSPPPSATVTSGLFLATALMLLFRKRYPRWWFDFLLELTRFATRVGAYVLLLTDRYPSTVDAQTVHLDIDYPDVDRDLNRALPLVKWLLAIPHYVVLVVLGLGVAVCTVIAWFSVLFTGRYPETFFDFVVGALRWGLRVNAYAFILATDEYPPFRLR